LLDTKESTILGDFREVSLDLGSYLNEASVSNLNYLFEFAKRINLVVDGNSTLQVSKIKEILLKTPEEFKEQERMSLRWIGPKFQKMIGLFKQFKMKRI
jgi:hypothetical protein